MDSGHDPKSKGDGYTRLHITPLDLDLAKIVVPANGRNLSLHTIETFPEKRYGFVDLPSADADKLKRKLHGSTLKGVKMRIEQARPEQNQTEESKQKKGQKRSRISGTTTDDAALPSSKKHRSSSSSSSKSEIGVIEGVALHDRKVKRGWTEPVATSKKKKSKHDATATTKKMARPRHKSKYTDQDECLLKTKLPPNAVGNLSTAERRRDKKRKRRDDGREVTVHEFEKTTKFPSFLKTVVPQTLGKPAVEFVEDKGWVDEDGELVEAVKPRAKGIEQKKGEARNKKQQQQQQQQPPPPTAVQEESDDETSSSGESSDEETMPPPPSKAAAGQSLEEGGSDSSSDDDTTTTVQNQSPNPLRSGAHQPLLPLQRPLSSSDAKSPQQQQRPLSSSSSSRNSLTIKIPPPPATPSAASTNTTTNAKVHPLEALYKRSASQSAAGPSHAESQQQQQQQQFSFFDHQSDADADDAAGAAAPAVPMTPFTRADLEWRNVRSAAPTPDTAHPSSRARSSYFWGSDDYDDDEEEDEADSSSRTQIHVDAQPAQQQQEKDKGHKSEPAVSDFQSLFWDNRGDLNRSWMGRRKTAAKAKRHRANKARAYRAL